MKLGIKIFCCVTVFFHALFLLGGYALLSFFYGNLMEREVENAAAQYQYRKFVVQAALITGGDAFDVQAVASEPGRFVALCNADGEALYSEFADESKLSGLIGSLGEEGEVRYQFAELSGRHLILTAGSLSQGGRRYYLVCGMDIGQSVRQQEQLFQRFSAVYAGVVLLSVILVWLLSRWISGPLTRLNAAANSIAAGNYAERIPAAGNDEVGQLAENFNRMADAVEEKIRELTEYARRQEEFAANLSHELKTPLTSIIGYSERIGRRKLSGEELQRAAACIREEGLRLERLSHKMMELTNLRQNDFCLCELRADELLCKTVRTFEELLENRHAQLSVEAQPALIRAEGDLLETLLFNLIDNSLKAGAAHIAVSGCLTDDSEYQIRVRDDGAGIPKEKLERITEAFYMVDKARSRKEHGAGLGLALAERIARLHGGSLRFASEPGQGTEAVLILKGRKVN